MKEFKYTIQGKAYNVVVESDNNNVIELRVNGTPYSVEKEEQKSSGEAERSAKPVQSAQPQPVMSATAAKTEFIQKSPMPGTITDIICKEGDVVKRGDTIVVIEAMKMDNNILAEKSGTIAKIFVNVGDTVPESGDLVVIA